MPGYVALLRGINLGGKQKVGMADLRDLLVSLGYENVGTYLNSGNALLTTPGGDPARVAREIEAGIADHFGLTVPVLVRTPGEFAAVIEANPYPETTADPSRLHVCFLSEAPEREWVDSIDRRRFEPDEFRLGDRALYIRYPNGAGRSKLTNDFLQRSLGVMATSRNWNTVVKLADLLAG